MDIRQILMGPPERPAPALDIIAFPTDHVRQLCVLQDGLQEARKNGLIGIRAGYDLWQFVSKTLPATIGKNCRLNLTNRLHPMVEITGNSSEERPVIGKRGVRKVIDVPRNELYRTMELADMRFTCCVSDYEFWLHLATLVPELNQVDTESHWHFACNSEAMWLSRVEGECCE